MKFQELVPRVGGDGRWDPPIFRERAHGEHRIEVEIVGNAASSRPGHDPAAIRPVVIVQRPADPSRSRGHAQLDRVGKEECRRGRPEGEADEERGQAHVLDAAEIRIIRQAVEGRSETQFVGAKVGQASWNVELDLGRELPRP